MGLGLEGRRDFARRSIRPGRRSSADVRLAKLCLYWVTPLPPTPSLGGPEGDQKLRCFLGCAFDATEGFGHVFLGQHHQHNWAFVSRFWPGRVLKPHMCGVKKEIGGPNRPHDAHDAGSWGFLGPQNAL